MFAPERIQVVGLDITYDLMHTQPSISAGIYLGKYLRRCDRLSEVRKALHYAEGFLIGRASVTYRAVDESGTHSRQETLTHVYDARP